MESCMHTVAQGQMMGITWLLSSNNKVTGQGPHCNPINSSMFFSFFSPNKDDPEGPLRFHRHMKWLNGTQVAGNFSVTLK